MSNLWPHASVKHPCPICGKTDWCQFGDKAMLCQRVVSDHPNTNPRGTGFYHFYSSERPEYIPRYTPLQPAAIDARALMDAYISGTTHGQIEDFATLLGVSYISLVWLGCAWSSDKRAFAFPMRDENENIVGIRLRNSEGFKWTVSGSKSGMFVPQFNMGGHRVYIVEGPTDAAAALTIGLPVIGRPNCNSCVDETRALVKNLGFKEVVLIRDNDDFKQRPDGTTWNPGFEGAKKLKAELGMRSTVFTPPSPCKDLRAFIRSINHKAARQIIESSANSSIWTRR